MASRPRMGRVVAWALAAVALALPSRADEGVTPHVELVVGACDMSADDVILTPPPDRGLTRLEGTGPTLGVRGGVTLRRWRFTAALARTWRDSDPGGLERRRFELDAGRLFGSPDGARLLLHGGAGVTRSRATDAQEAEARSSTVGTLSLGVGGHVPIGPRFFLRPDVSARHHAGGDDGTDWELSVGFGFALGKRAPAAASSSPPPSN